jgi:hypothetical protein
MINPGQSFLLGLCLFSCTSTAALAADSPTLRVEGVVPFGIRNTTTESWGVFACTLTNLTETDRLARVLVFYEGRPEEQYGRDVWVPARATLTTWLLVGKAADEPAPNSRKIQKLVYDRTDGQDRLILPPTEERIRSDPVQYRRREPSTAIILDDRPLQELVFGQLPQPETRADEALHLARVFRATRNLSETVLVVNPGLLPPTQEALHGVDHVILATDRIANDLAGLRALRHWVQQGGKLLILLDMITADMLVPLLGDDMDFQLVDRVGLNRFRLETSGSEVPPDLVSSQEHERPVALVRVLLPAGERARHTVNGWPAWFMRDVGRGKIVFSALGPRGWHRARRERDKPSPFENYPSLPIAIPEFDFLATELQPPREENPFDVDVFRDTLRDEIGYSVISRGTVTLLFAGFLAGIVGIGLLLRRTRRPELVGWTGPAAALLAAVAFFGLGEWSRRSAVPTVAVAQIVNADAGTAEVPIHGLLAVYRPESGPANMGAEQSGRFDLEIEPDESAGQTRRWILADQDAWHVEGLSLPAGVRFAPFHITARTDEPIRVTARFGPEGLQGKLAAGPFHDLADALLITPGGRNASVRLKPDGSFTAAGADILPHGQFLASALLSDRQQRRQELYRHFLRQTGSNSGEGRLRMMAWAEPIDTHFTLLPNARTVGTALLLAPVRLERSTPGTRVTVPGPFIASRRILPIGATRVPATSNLGMDMRLRFQLPAGVLPFRIDQARLSYKIDAPSRRITVAGIADGNPVELHSIESPLDPVQVEMKDEGLLRLDADGGLYMNFAISDAIKSRTEPSAAQPDPKWSVEYLELEVTGTTGER